MKPSAVAARFLRPAAAMSAAGLAAALVPVTAISAASRPATAPVPVLSWRPCDGGFQCANARVPLDYRHPRGATISIAVIRHRATDPAHRVGSLFFNSGGPNEQIESFAAGFGEFPAALRARFNIVTFDPRGFGYSTAVRCFPTAGAESKFLAGLPHSPSARARMLHGSGPTPGSMRYAPRAAVPCSTTTPPRMRPAT
jgi:hypothetical protein